MEKLLLLLFKNFFFFLPNRPLSKRRPKPCETLLLAAARGSSRPPPLPAAASPARSQPPPLSPPIRPAASPARSQPPPLSPPLLLEPGNFQLQRKLDPILSRCFPPAPLPLPHPIVGLSSYGELLHSHCRVNRSHPCPTLCIFRQDLRFLHFFFDPLLPATFIPPYPLLALGSLSSEPSRCLALPPFSFASLPFLVSSFESTPQQLKP